MNENIKVYVKVDNNNVITQVDSSIFLFNVEDWVKIDEGAGDKFSHAQGNYFEKGLIDSKSNYNYKLVYGKIVELTEEEKEKLFPAPKQELSLEDRIAMLENLQLQQEGVI
ncbi:hypothetical protein [Clostridium saccharoperbutylacetonicum]|uniref:hypothetical protein n=1 Tax=Clostridium saccharoperbutylacetonicum TaxID=36745 RepID=UPI0039E92F2B